MKLGIFFVAMCVIAEVYGFQSLRDGDTFPRNIRQKAPVDSKNMDSSEVSEIPAQRDFLKHLINYLELVGRKK